MPRLEKKVNFLKKNYFWTFFGGNHGVSRRDSDISELKQGFRGNLTDILQPLRFLCALFVLCHVAKPAHACTV